MENDRRTKRTKKLLTNAFIVLLSEKNLNEITVKELCEKADINRGTFYLHYQDIYDLKQQIETNLYEELLNLIQPFSDTIPLDTYQVFYNLFSFAKKNATLFQALLGPNGDISFLTDLKTLFKEYYLSTLMQGRDLDATIHLEYAYDFISAGFTGIVTTWLNEPSPRSIDEMAKLTSKMVFKGLPALVSELKYN